jgi:uncharacterized RDD family membrane protein YckC
MSETLKPPVGTSYATFWERLAAYVIDWVITSLALAVLQLPFNAIVHNGFYNDRLVSMFNGFAGVATFLVILGYFAFMESSEKQATFGKQVMGLIVTTEEGERLDLVSAMLRYFAKIISTLPFFIGFLFPLFTIKRQALHDLIVKTVVIKK